MRWILQLHNRTRLFVKVLVVNGLIVLVGAAGGVAIFRFSVADQYRWWEMIGFVVLGLTVSLAVNFFLLRLAFQPLFRLQEVMEAIRRGEFTARSPVIAGDPDVNRLTETFNLMLDRLDAYRQSVSSQVLEALEEERKRIARELHDETGQALTSIVIRMELAEQSLPADSPLRDQIRATRTYTIETLEEIRRLTYDLRPSILDDLGLVPAIRWYLKNRLDEQGPEANLEVDPALSGLRLSEETEVALFRIVQEALTNVRKHGQATRVNVRIWVEQGRIRVRVEDNGRGFDVEEVLSREVRDRGLGLFGMKERAALVGGVVHIRSVPGRGTVVEVSAPIHAREEEGSDE